jgi:type II secretory pathway pseudopilin PulG
MRSNFDFSSWQGVLSTLVGLVIVSFVAIGIRLLLMHSVQLRRERQNRQINERLKTLIAAYKTLGGSFTGELAVDPRHLRELRRQAPAEADAAAAATPSSPFESAGSDRRRRTRDAVEAALSDVILLGTREQVRLAARAANDMVAGRPIETAELVTSLRAFIREVLDLEAIPVEFAIPRQGPTRTGGASARGGRADKQGNAGGGAGGKGGGGTGGGFAADDPMAPPDHSAH